MQTSFSRFDRTVELSPPKDLPEATIKYLIDYGWKQSLSDSFASATNADEFEGKLRKRFDKLVAGTMSEPRVGGPRITDPVGKEIKRLFTIALTAWHAKRKAEKKPVASAELVALWTERYNAQYGESDRAKAERNVAEQNALPMDDDFLEGLDDTE